MDLGGSQMSAATLYCATCGAANPADAPRCFACGNPPQAHSPYEFIPAVTSPSGTFSGTASVHHLLKQRYHLLRQVGKGGFGAVYQAQDTQLGNRLVAVKEMSQRGLTPEELREATENFQREALLLASLHHPNLPHIYEQFEEAGRWYLVMEFIEGETLEARLSRAPAGLPIDETLQIGLQLSKALGYLHSRQPPIIFRDLKPANIMLTPERQVYLIDFGIARLFKPGQTKDTEAFGSAGYAAPEQYGKAQTTAQSDIYGLGATLYHLLSGDDPSDHPFLFKPLSLPAAPALATLITQMLEQDKAKRPADMPIVERELERIKEEYTAGQKYTSAVISTSQAFIASKMSTTPTQKPIAQPTQSQGAITFQRPTGWSMTQSDGLKIAGLFISAILIALIIVLVVNALPFHQEIKTGNAVTEIQVGSGYNGGAVTGESDTFHVGDTVYVVFNVTVSPPGFSFNQPGTVEVKLFLGNSLKQSDEVSTGNLIFGPLEDSATVTESGIYKWEIDDDQGDFEASITFQVT
jgi:serine/threonine protein kinase